MALVLSGNTSDKIGGGNAYYELYADQTWASGTQRTVRLTLKLKINGKPGYTSYFGYPADWKGMVNGVWSGKMRVKGGEQWTYVSGKTYSFTWDYTTDVGTTSSKSISVGFQLDSHTVNIWDTTRTGNFTVGSTNSKPVMSGNCSTDPSGTFSEKEGTIVITTPTGKDAENNIKGYRIQTSINGGGWTEIYRGGYRTYNHNISSYGEGTSFRYRADCWDSGYLWSEAFAYSPTVYKNKFTMATLSSSSDINYNSNSINFTFSGGNNTQSGIGTDYSISCQGLTIHNSGKVSSPFSIQFKKGSESISGPYIVWSDLVSKFKSANGKGTLTFVLTGVNKNGTSKTSTKAISVDLQTAPNAVQGVAISTDSRLSTNYVQVRDTGNWYFIPDGVKTTRVQWNAVEGKLGDTVSYEVYVAYGSGGWNYLTKTSSTYYNHAVPKQTVSQQFKYKIRAVSSYNSSKFSEGQSPAQTLHFYNGVGLIQGNITRTASSAEVNITVKSNTSIPSVNTVGSWRCSNGRTGNLSQSQKEQVISIGGLSEDGAYTLTVTYNDGTGLTKSNQTATIAVSANQPIFFVNKYGAGIGGEVADSSKALNVKGAIYASDKINTSKIEATSGTLSGTINAGNVQVGGNNVYHTGRKPSAADIGALSINGGEFTGTLYSNIPSSYGSGFTVKNGTSRTMVYSSSTKGEHIFGGNNDGGIEVKDYLRVGPNKLEYTTGGTTNRVFHTGSTDVNFKGLGKSVDNVGAHIYRLPNGIIIYTSNWWVPANSERRINFPSGLFKSEISPPITSMNIPDNNWNRYATHNEIGCTSYDKNGFTLVNYPKGKESVVSVLVIGV